MLRLDCRADVDGGQGGENECLDPDDDDDFEDIEQGRRREHEQENPGLKDEDEQIDDEDEEEERRDIREPPPDRLRRQSLFGDLHLCNLVDLLADGLPYPRLYTETNAHQEDPEQDRQDGPEQEVGNCLRDRE